MGGVVNAVSSLFGGGQPSAPAAPDYTGAAQQTAAGNLEQLKYQTQANRVNQYTPWGSQTWQDQGNGQWAQTTSLTPSAQASLNAQQQIQDNQSSLANKLQGQVASTMGNGFNAPTMEKYLQGVNTVNQSAPQFSQATADAGTQAAYNAQMGLVQPQMDQDTKNLDTQLRLQGLTPGTEAYNTAAQNLGRTQTATTTQIANQAVLSGNQMANLNYASALNGYSAGNAAQDQAYNQGMNTYGTAYSSALQNYLQPLNSMNAVLSGQQVQNPTMPTYNTAGLGQGVDYSGAASALGQWNSGVYAQKSANNSADNAVFGQILGAAGSAYGSKK